MTHALLLREQSGPGVLLRDADGSLPRPRTGHEGGRKPHRVLLSSCKDFRCQSWHGRELAVAAALERVQGAGTGHPDGVARWALTPPSALPLLWAQPPGPDQGCTARSTARSPSGRPALPRRSVCQASPTPVITPVNQALAGATGPGGTETWGTW